VSVVPSSEVLTVISAEEIEGVTIKAAIALRRAERRARGR
jgi:hypothetical protein